MHGSEPETVSHSGLEIRVCVRTYKLFYVSKTEDVLQRIITRDEIEQAEHRLRARTAVRRACLERFGTTPTTPPS